MHALPPKKRVELNKRYIGFVFQKYHLLDDLTVYENLEIPLSYRDVSRKSERRSLPRRSIGFRWSGRRTCIPRQLSGGQQQLVGVARAVIANPKLLLADEPTGNLHSAQGEEIMELFTRLNQQGVTIVQVTHSERNASYSHRTIQLRDGWIVEPERQEVAHADSSDRSDDGDEPELFVSTFPPDPADQVPCRILPLARPRRGRPIGCPRGSPAAAQGRRLRHRDGELACRGSRRRPDAPISTPFSSISTTPATPPPAGKVSSWSHELQGIDATLPAIVMTAWGSVDKAVEAVRRGARDFIEKPWDNTRLLTTPGPQVELGRALRRTHRLEGENRLLRRDGIPEMIAESVSMRPVVQLMTRVAPSDANILITGEHGTGKEVVAQRIDAASGRAGRPFVAVNLGGLSEGLFESEMFGHVKGAFTDARTDRIGRFELADGAPSCSTKSALSRLASRPSSCAYSKVGRSNGSAPLAPGASMFGFYRRRTPISRRR